MKIKLLLFFILFFGFFLVKKASAQYTCAYLCCDVDPWGNGDCTTCIDTPPCPAYECWWDSQCPDATPTPTRTPTPTPAQWYKLKTSSFHKSGTWTDVLPLTMNPYDSQDDGSGPSYNFFNVVDPGIVSSSDVVNLDPARISTSGWKISSYSRSNNLSPSVFIDYIKSRKEYATITSLNTLDQTKVNLYSGSLTITNPSDFNNKKVVLIIDGSLTIDVPNFQPANSSLAILAKGSINITAKVKEMNGVFIGNAVDFASDIAPGNTTPNPLKIKGNIIASASNNSEAKRNRTDDVLKPSIFIVVDANSYLDLLPYLSISTYEWTEMAP